MLSHEAHKAKPAAKCLAAEIALITGGREVARPHMDARLAVSTGWILIRPLTMAGYVGLPPEKANAAAGLMNIMRNIGMSVGTSAVTTLIPRRSQYHQSVLAESTHSGRFQAAIEAMTTRLSHAGFSAHDAQRSALGGTSRARAATLPFTKRAF